MPKADPAEIRRALATILEAGAVAELRVLHSNRGTVSGYFDDLEQLALAAAEWSGKAPAVYVTLNPVNRELLARAVNQAKPYAKHTTGDADIAHRRWLLIDLDPVRPQGISSTDAEHAAALGRAEAVIEWLMAYGFTAEMMLLADSGNGAHVLIHADLPNDSASHSLVERCLAALAFQFTDAAVAVDVSVKNAARIIKLYGTAACKGDSTAQRPHRLARLLLTPERLAVTPRALLEQLAARAPKAERRSTSSRTSSDFELQVWIAEHAEVLHVVRDGPWNGGWKWILNPCPWNPDHANGAAYIVQHSNGAIAAGCHHNGCSAKNWHALRDVVEPGWRQVRRGGEGCSSGFAHEGRRLVLVPASDVAPENVTFAWAGRIPLGAVSLLAGQPGLGKSTLTIELAARLSRGQLEGDLLGTPVPVLLATAEDALSPVVVPRLVAAGADLRLIHFITVKQGEHETGFVLPDDVDALQERMIEVRARAVIVDPLIAHLSGHVDAHRDQDARTALAPLARLADDARAAVLGVMHLNKAQGGNPLNRVGGSIGFPAAARSVLLLGEDPKDDTGRGRVVAHAKANFGPHASSVRIRIESRSVEGSPGVVATSGVAWCGEAREVRAADLLVERPADSAVDEAKDAMVEILANGPRPAAAVEREMKRRGISNRTCHRAKAQLGVQSTKTGFGSGWLWELPEGCQVKEVATFATCGGSQEQNPALDAEDCHGAEECQQPQVATFHNGAAQSSLPGPYEDDGLEGRAD